MTSHDSWFVVCVHARSRASTRRRRPTSDDRRARRRATTRETTEFARGTTNGRTMTDDASRDDSCIHAFATRARGVCPYIHRRERARLVRRIFSRRTRASIGRTRRRARREVVESTPRVISFIHSFIRMNACHRMKNCVIDGTSRRDASMRTRRNGERKPPTTASRAFASVVVASRARGRWTTR